MTQAIQANPILNAAEKTNPVSGNPAVALCCEARNRVYLEQKARHRDEFDANCEANKAFRNAMPPLSGYENICNFVACVAHGILTGSIEGKNGSKLLYAAQVAFSTVRHQPEPSKSAA